MSDELLVRDMTRKTSEEMLKRVLMDAEIMCSGLSSQEIDTKLAALFIFQKGVISTMCGSLGAVVQTSVRREIDLAQTHLLLFYLARASGRVDIVTAVGAIDEMEKRVTGSTLERASLIEEDFCRLKAQEWAVEIDTARDMIRRGLDSVAPGGMPKPEERRS